MWLKLLQKMQLHKEENEHLKQTYKELFDSIKKKRIQNKDNSESLISQINQKSVENADLKAQIQEKVFANAALNNELRKLKGNIVDSKFTKASILGKPPLQPSRNHLVVRQPNAFTSERPRISRPRFASQVDEKNDLSKTVTPHYLPKVRESAAAKPHQVNAPNYSRNSHKELYGSNDMVHAYFLEDARKMTQDKTRIPNHRDMASTRAHCTPNACTPKLRKYIGVPLYTMAEENIPAPEPTRRDEQILHCSEWLQIGKGNLLLDLQKLQKNPIFRISVDIRQNTNFVRAFTTSANVPSIYIQLFWNTLTHDAKTGVYSFQVDEHWLTLSADLLRKALDVTPADSAHPFESPPAGKTDTCEQSTSPVESNPIPDQLVFYGQDVWQCQTQKSCSANVMGHNIHKEKSFFKLVDEDEVQPAPEPHVDDDEYNLQRGTQMSLEASQAHATQDETTGPSAQPEDASSAQMVCETLSHADAETGEDATNTVALEERTIELDEGQARSNTEQSHVALAGPNPEPMHGDFLTTIYPKVHKSLKHTTEEHVHLENPPSSSETLSSMKNLEDNFTFGDQFINDKSQEDEPGKTTMETELESMVTIPIQQASSSIPLLSTLVIDLSPPKPMSPPFQEPIIVNFHHQHPHYNRAEHILKCSGPALHEMTTATNIVGLIPKPPSSVPFVPPTRNEWETLLQPLFDEYSRTQPNVDALVSEVAALVPAVSTSIEEDDHDIEVAHMKGNSGNKNTIPEPSSEESSSQNVHLINQPPEHIYKWTKDHPIENVIGNPSRSVSTRHQLQDGAMFCYFDAFLSSVKPKTYKEALEESCWIEAMQ
ncbi:hypothetical protein Tco_0836992 [Tanacetum coccineum]